MANFKFNIEVEVVFAGKEGQLLQKVHLHLKKYDDARTVRDAVMASGILDAYPEIQAWEDKVGIFGEQVSPDTIIKNGDRIEIYRSLIHDPKESRLQRVAIAKKALARERSKPKHRTKKLK